MALINTIHRVLTDSENPPTLSQREVLTLLSETTDNRGQADWAPRNALYDAANLTSHCEKENNHGLRRILGAISLRFETPDWYQAEEAPDADGGRRYRLGEGLCDVVSAALAL